MRDQELSVELVEQYQPVEAPSPLEREDLKAFLRCYEMVARRAPPNTDDGERLSAITGNIAGHNEIGDYAFKRADWGGTSEDDDNRPAFVNRIALIRNLKMVVEYEHTASDSYTPIVGVFVAASSINDVLRLAEPSTHDKWDPESSRLESTDSFLVFEMLRRLRQRAREFQRFLQPAAPVIEGPLRFLESQLAKFLRAPTKRNPPAPPRGRDPFQINLEQARVMTDDGVVVRADVRIVLKEESGLERLAAEIVLRSTVLADDNQSVDEQISVNDVTITEGSGEVTLGAPAIVAATLSRSQPLRLTIQSAAFEPDWIASFSVAVSAARD